MTFVSFAQNFEDVMLWRALKHVPNGFYVDVGAADPDQESVTRAFYDRGWRGINIEPEPVYAAALRERRPRDVNLELAVGQVSGRIEMFLIRGTGLSTFDRSIANRHEAAGFPTAVVCEVEVSTLAAICAKHAAADTHFLKIDAEGAERDILLGADFKSFRPWIIVVEATEPFSPVRTIERFEDLLRAAQYQFRWFDGLNAFFIAAEHDDELRSYFELPPNFYDSFVDHKLLTQAGRADQAEAASACYQSKLREAQEQVARLEKHVRDLGRMNQALAASNRQLEALNQESSRQAVLLQEQLRAVFASASWQITSPLRRARNLMGW